MISQVGTVTISHPILSRIQVIINTKFIEFAFADNFKLEPAKNSGKARRRIRWFGLILVHICCVCVQQNRGDEMHKIWEKRFYWPMHSLILLRLHLHIYGYYGICINQLGKFNIDLIGSVGLLRSKLEKNNFKVRKQKNITIFLSMHHTIEKEF